MEHLLNSEMLSHWLMHYGSIAIFVLLAVGIIILPVPEETLMVIAGILMRKGSLNIHSTLVAAYAGSISGITVSYILGRTAGYYLIHNYGKWVGLNQEKIDKVHQWFEKFGKWTLTIGYFIPGIRHFTGFASGMSQLDYKQFALFAYSGAVIWVTTFISIGYFFGEYCFTCFETFETLDVLIFLGVIIVILLIIFFMIKPFSYFKSEDKK